MTASTSKPNCFDECNGQLTKSCVLNFCGPGKVCCKRNDPNNSPLCPSASHYATVHADWTTAHHECLDAAGEEAPQRQGLAVTSANNGFALLHIWVLAGTAAAL